MFVRNFSSSPGQRWKHPLASLLVCLLLTPTTLTAAAELSPDKCLVFGPGIEPDRVGLPVNYFFIQAVDTEGKK